jgi:foldase protein PrsA
VANAGRGFVFNHQLQLWVSSSKNFAGKNQMEVPTDLDKSVLKELADYLVVSQEANRLKVGLSDKEITEKFDLTIEGIGSKDQAVDFLKQMYGLSMNQFKRMITPMILVEKVKEEKFTKVKVRHILIKDENKAKDIAKKAKEGGNFEDLAKENSEDQTSKDKGGLIAEGEYLFRDSGLVTEFEEAMFKMKPGEISDPVKSEYGYHIIKLEDKKGEIDLKYADWLEALKKKHPVRMWI